VLLPAFQVGHCATGPLHSPLGNDFGSTCPNPVLLLSFHFIFVVSWS
jgi:hypothetical protein